MYGARVRPVLPPHRAARQDRARRARPRRRIRHPTARPADERLADRDPRSRRAVLAGTVRRVGGPDHEPMPAGRDRPTGQARPRRGHRARRTGRRRWRSGSDHRRDARHPAFLPGGEAARPWDAATGALVRRPRRRRSCAPPLSRDRRPGRPWRRRCRCRRPRTVCVVPRERGGGTGGVEMARRKGTFWQREKGPLCRVVVATWPDGAERREATSGRVPINALSSVERGPSGSVGRL